MNISLAPGSVRSLSAAVNQSAADINRELLTLPDLAQEDPVSAVHLVRKRFKLYRAFVKLFRNCGPEEKLKTANRTLRDLGKQFSELRDAHVRSETLRLLLSDEELEHHKEATMALLQHNDKTIMELETELLDEQHLFTRLESGIRPDTTIDDYLQSLTPSASCIRAGITGTFTQCHALNVMRQSDSEPDPDRLHEWRKRTKDLQYQYELSVHFMPASLRPSAENINALTELLGHDQDLHNLKTWIPLQADIDIADNDAAALLSRLKHMRKHIGKKIDRLGNRIFSVTPEEFADQLNVYGHDTAG